MKTKATKRPWKTIGGKYVVGKTGYEVGPCTGWSDDDFDLMLHAVNTHDALVEALEGLCIKTRGILSANEEKGRADSYMERGVFEAIDKARAALAPVMKVRDVK